MTDITKWENNEIPVDFESEWFQNLVELQYHDDVGDVESVTDRMATRVEVRDVQYLLGRHLRTKEVRVVTNRPLTQHECDVCGLDGRLEPVQGFQACESCASALLELDDHRAGVYEPCAWCGTPAINVAGWTLQHFCADHSHFAGRTSECVHGYDKAVCLACYP